MGKEKIKNIVISIVVLIIELSILILILIFDEKIEIYTSLLMFGLSIVACVSFSKSFSVVKMYANNLSKKIIIVAVYLITAFQLVGYNCFIFPLEKSFVLKDLIIFLLAILWSVPIVNYGSMILYKSSIKVKNTKKIHKILLLILWSLFLIGPAVFCLYVYNPGITSYDTYAAMLENAMHLHGMVDWHPAFYCIIIRIIETIWNSTYSVIIFHYIFWLLIVLDLLLFLREEGISERTLIIVSLFLGLNTSNVLYLNTIWKDIPYGLALLWLFVILSKLFFGKKEYQERIYIYIQFIVSLVLVFLLRKNGFVPYVITVIITTVLAFRNRKLIISIAVSALTIILIKGLAYSYFDVQAPPRGGTYIGLSQDILGVYYSNGELSDVTLNMVKIMTGGNSEQYEYIPMWSTQEWPYPLDVSVSDFILAYIDTFLKNPVVMIRAIIARNDAIWDIFIPKGAVLGTVKYTGTNDGFERNNLAWNDYYPERIKRDITPIIDNLLQKTVDVQWLNVLFWRTGIYIFFSIITIMFLLVFGEIKREILILLSPGIGQVMGLILSTGWADFRYYWSLNLLSIGFIFVAIVICRKKMKEMKDECI